MTEKEYREGIVFIKKVSATPEEKAERITYWVEKAFPLVRKKLSTPSL